MNRGFKNHTYDLKYRGCHFVSRERELPMEYSWLKVVETLWKSGRKMSLGELKADLDSRGFRLSEDELKHSISKMQELGLVEADLLHSG